MAIERKCLNCGTWNKANDFCTNCGSSISPQQITKERIEAREKEKREEKPSGVNVFLKKLKKSKNPFIKVTYYVLASLWAVYMFLLASVLYLSAVSNG